MLTLVSPSMFEDLDGYINSLITPKVTAFHNNIQTKLPESEYTPEKVLNKLNTVGGVGSGLDVTTIANLVPDDFLRFKGLLADTENFNTFTESGIWHQAANANAAVVRNYPIALAGILTVTQISAAMVYQEYRTYANDQTYRRTLYNGTWFPWKRFMDGNSPSFSAHGSISTGVGPKTALLQYTRTNKDNIYNPANGRATIQQAGVYHIHFTGLSENGYYSHAYLRKNDADVTYTYYTNSNYNMYNLQFVGPCVVGDYFSMFIPNSSYAPYSGGDANSGYNRFWGEYLGLI